MYQRQQLIEGEHYFKVEHPLYKYCLTRDITSAVSLKGKHVNEEWYRLAPMGVLVVKKGYHYDGPSGPTIDTPDSMRGSLCHDVIYQMLRRGHLMDEYDAKEHKRLRRAADRVMVEIMKADGMPWWRRTAWWLGVRFGGKKHTLPRYY